MASNRLRRFNKEQGEEAKMDMSPMIDMVFLLLLFFLVVSNPRTIKVDNEVKPPVALNAKVVKEKRGRIIINIRKDGEYRAEDINTRLESEEQLEDYFKEQKQIWEGKGFDPRLHIRGDKDTVFKHCRKVIRAAAREGIDEVIFGAYNNPQNN